MHFFVRAEKWPLARPFVTAREVMTNLPLVYLEISAGGFTGRTEAAGVDYRGETAEGLAEEITAFLQPRKQPPSRVQLLEALPPGGARNAIDCALWDLESKASGRSVMELAGLSSVTPLETVYTLSLGSPSQMASAVGFAPRGAILKLKLGGGDNRDVDRAAAVRAAAPDSRLVADINEGWTRAELDHYAAPLAALGVEMIEQPLPAGEDQLLKDYKGPIPLCADESANVASDLPQLAAYDFINIKLDKTGGLTAALALADAALAAGKRLMVGSMLGTSLGMAPAFVIGQRCTYVDLDGPMLLAKDRAPAMRFDGKVVFPPRAELWG
jgi:L-Ala-D/L-Glu epimerase